MVSAAAKFTWAKLARKIVQYIQFAYFVASRDYGGAFAWFCFAVVIEIVTVFIPNWREKKSFTRLSKTFLLLFAIIIIVIADLFQFFNVLSFGSLFKEEYEELRD
jgi:hypothetical protein